MMHTIHDVEQRLYPYGKKMLADLKLDKVRFLLDQLGNPQNSYQVIHVAGTSGKGTTCWMMSHCLSQLGYRVGCTMSPHIVDLRERCMINNQLLDESVFVSYMNVIKQVIDTDDRSAMGQPSYFEIMTAAALYIFGQEGVNYAVVEVGLGGRLDATNIISSPDKVCIVTSIGYDHQKFLGDTLDLIAREKAMITHEGNHCFRYLQDDMEIDDIIASVVYEQGGVLHTVSSDCYYPLPSHFVGQHNQLNVAIVGGVLDFMAEERGLQGYDTVSELMENCPPLLARMQILPYHGKQVIIDGAHNTQKMSSFIQGLGEISGTDRRYVFVLAFKEDKNVGEVLQVILPYASAIICTEFGQLQQDYPLHPMNAEVVAAYCRDLGCEDVMVEYDHHAILAMLDQYEDDVVITGSFFLASSFITLLTHEI